MMELSERAYERGASRLTEIRNYAIAAGIKRIGIAHCVSLTQEATAVEKYLSDGFVVKRVDCKCERIQKKELLGGESTSILCNPAGQAAFLESEQTELNISMGLCMGHDMIFNKTSVVPVTTLVVKDRVHQHNPIEGIRNIPHESNHTK